MNFINKWFGKVRPAEQQCYKKPNFDCSSLILLSGPAYNDKTFSGSFLVNSIALREWTLAHSQKVWSSDRLKQEARLYLPVWLERVSPESNSYVTLLDLTMRDVLVPYTLDFYRKGWCVIYCHDCHRMHDSMNKNTHNHWKIGNTSSWVEEWLCPLGHIIHYKQSEVRWLTGR